MEDLWKAYRFHYRYYIPFEGPRLVEMAETFMSFRMVELFICYLFVDKSDKDKIDEYVEIDDDVIILNLSTINSGHSLDEAVSFVSFYKEFGGGTKVGINTFILDHLPHVYQFVRKFIEDENIIILDKNKKYFIKRAYMRRNTHYNYVKNWKSIPYTEKADQLTFQASATASLDFVDSPSLLQTMSHDIWRANHGRFAESDIVMLCKTTDESLAATPKRAMYLSSERRDHLINAGIRILSPSQIRSFDEYVSVLHGCRTFITSYGAAACTNRFFVNPAARVVVLANRHYDSEYAGPSDPPFRHLRQTHLFPVTEQKFILNHNNEFEDTDIGNLLEMVLN